MHDYEELVVGKCKKCGGTYGYILDMDEKKEVGEFDHCICGLQPAEEEEKDFPYLEEEKAV